MGKSVKKKNNVYAATKETEESRKDTFYDAVKLTVEACPKYIKTILGDVNSQVRMERVFRRYIATRTWFGWKEIHKQMCTSPEKATINQIGHVIIERRHISDG